MFRSSKSKTRKYRVWVYRRSAVDLCARMVFGQRLYWSCNGKNVRRLPRVVFLLVQKVICAIDPVKVGSLWSVCKPDPAQGLDPHRVNNKTLHRVFTLTRWYSITLVGFNTRCYHKVLTRWRTLAGFSQGIKYSRVICCSVGSDAEAVDLKY